MSELNLAHEIVRLAEEKAENDFLDGSGNRNPYILGSEQWAMYERHFDLLCYNTSARELYRIENQLREWNQ